MSAETPEFILIDTAACSISHVAETRLIAAVTWNEHRSAQLN
jgi:hypothetical protein